MKWMRATRGLFGTAVLWGVAWSLLSVPTFVHVLSDPPPGIDRIDLVVGLLSHSALLAFLYGSSCGALFGLAVALTSKRLKDVRSFSTSRAAVLGLVAGVGIPIALTGGGSMMPLVLSGLLGAATAATALVVARRAPTSSILGSPDSLRLPTN